MVSNRNITRQERRRILRQQRIMGVVLLVLSLIAFAMCCTGQNAIDNDVTAVILFICMALYAIFTKSIFFCL